MLYLTEPRWLWVSAGIILPILIHLAKGVSGKTLPVGSIRFLQEDIKSAASGLKIREFILLLLRCLGILLLAVLLSDPVWKSPFEGSDKKGWILVEKRSTMRMPESFLHTIDSLLQEGNELHLLENDFPKTSLSEVEQPVRDTSLILLPSYWSLLKKLQEKIPAGMPVYIFSGDRLNRFTGNRPELSLNLHWYFAEDGDTTVKWTTGTYLTPEDSVLILQGNSRATGTSFVQSIIKKPDSPFIFPDTGTLVVVLFCRPGSPDAGYVEAALGAVRDYTRHKLIFSHAGNMDSINRRADWIFWLSETAIPETLRSKNIFLYKPGAPVQTSSRIFPVYSNEDPEISISQIILSSPDSSAQRIWSDGYGRPVLIMEEKDRKKYTFFSRFDPAWNGLPWSSFFPKFFLRLLYPEELSEADHLHDIRKISPGQAAPARLIKDIKRQEKKYQYTDLSGLIWILLFIIFCIERFLSWKRKEVAHA